MNKRAKLISLITSFCLMLTLLVVGVFAVRNVTVPMGGQINFTAKGVNAKVTYVSLTGGTLQESSSSMDTLIWTTYKDVTAQTDTTSWESIKIDVNADTYEVVLKVKVENTSRVATDKLYATFNANNSNPSTSNMVITTTEDATSIAPGADNAREYSITFSISEDTEYDFSESFSVDAILSCDEAVKPSNGYEPLKFYTNNDTKEATLSFLYEVFNENDRYDIEVAYPVIGRDCFTDGVLKIPAYIMEGGDVYSVTEISSGSIDCIHGEYFISSFQCQPWLEKVYIPRTMKQIGNNAFYENSIKTVVIDSKDIASGLTTESSQGYLIYNATTIYIKTGLSVSEYLSNTANFSAETITSGEYAGYTCYTKVA